MLEHVRRATIALTTTFVTTAVLGTALPAQATTTDSDAAAQWLVGQLQGGLLYQDFNGQSYAQYGPSLDVFFALQELDVQPDARQSILDAVESEYGNYVGSGGESYAGPTGKLLTAVQTVGLNPKSYADGDLLARLKTLVHVKHDKRFGRVQDHSQYGDFSNTITQAWDVRAFAGAQHRFTKRTTAYLLKQQCDAGFFRESMTGQDCDSAAKADRAPSVDATALALFALRAAKAAGVDGLDDDITQALKWLAKRQKANGSFTGNGGANSNSTGLAAWVLRDTKWSAAATKAFTWLDKLQADPENAAGTPLESDEGAVAYNRADFQAAQQDGIADADAITWALATAQSAVALSR